jgi:nucleoside-diphosphate-sugar epimerase
MGDWMDLVADRFGLPRPPRLARAALKARMPAESYSFMCESRRLDNSRLKQQLGVKLIYSTVQQGVPYEHAVGID